MADISSMSELWEDYLRKVVSPNAGEIQIKETKLAFYAGAGGLLGLIIENLDNESEPTEKDLKLMDSIGRELEDFARMISEGGRQ